MTNALCAGIPPPPIVLGGTGESALESADEAGVMPVSNHMSNFLDREVTYGEKLGCLL
jgi:hypothetical protein